MARPGFGSLRCRPAYRRSLALGPTRAACACTPMCPIGSLDRRPWSWCSTAAFRPQLSTIWAPAGRPWRTASGSACSSPSSSAPTTREAASTGFNAVTASATKVRHFSVRQMVEHMIQTHAIDRRRVFVTGLSAGGAMTSVMLAAYPEVFAGGAVITGVPYRAAIGAPAALRCMFQGQVRSAREWGALVRAASRHPGPWPKLSVWHGSADLTVAPVNAAEIIKQWADVHGLAADAKPRGDRGRLFTTRVDER